MIGKERSWIIDSGASNHMTGDLKQLRDVREIPSCPVGMPNGVTSVAANDGTVALGKNLVLKNVLYVPNLQCNLISFSQLLDESIYHIQFTANLCFI